MRLHKTAIPVLEEEIIPRFDLATEVLILATNDQALIQDKKIIVLPRPSGEELCHILLSENINTLICGAIEDEYYGFLKWKGIEVFDAVAGTWIQAFERWQARALEPGDILCQRQVEGIPR